MSSTAREPISLSFADDVTNGDWQLEETAVYGLATDQTERALYQAAADAGESLDSLLKSAAEHFQSSEVRPCSGAITEEMIDALAEDDERALD